MNFFGGGKEVTTSLKLPDPDAWGNYWLSRGGGRIHGPVILHTVNPVPIPGTNQSQHGGWFASRGGEAGVVFDGPRIRYFASAEKALEALNGCR